MNWFRRYSSWKVAIFTIGVVLVALTYTKDTLVRLVHSEESVATADASCDENQAEEDVYFTSCGGFF